MLPVPPPTYAGTERVVAALGDILIERGHEVTLYAPGDSEISGGTLVPTIERSLWSTEYRGDISAHVSISLAKVWADHERYDIIHSHIETMGFLFARYCPTPVVSTLHGRLDQAGAPELLEEFSDIPLVSISDSQRRFSPESNWVATVHHGLPFDNVPFSEQPGDYLAVVGRITPEKGIEEAIELARRTGLRLRMAAKVYDEHEKEHFAEVVQPALDDPDLDIEFLGEVDARARDPLLAGALATVMLGAWPEPFGLVAIESLGHRHAGHRAAGRRPDRDDRARRRRVPGRRRDRGRTRGAAGWRARPSAHPQAGARAVLPDPHGRGVRGDLPAGHRGARARADTGLNRTGTGRYRR